MFENALRALRDRFDVDAEVEVAHDGPFLNVAQGDGESLEAYHGRVLSIYRARGGRDKPVFADQPALTALEVSSISEWVYRFVLGLRDESLAHDAIDRGVLMFDSFRSAFQIVKESSGRLDVKVNVARAMAQQARINLIEEWFKQQLGHSANEELSRAYGLPNSLFDACGGPRDQAVPAQPSMSAQRISGGWNYYQPDQAYFPPVPQQRYDYWPQQTNVFQSAPAPAPAPVQYPAVLAPVSLLFPFPVLLLLWHLLLFSLLLLHPHLFLRLLLSLSEPETPLSMSQIGALPWSTKRQRSSKTIRQAILACEYYLLVNRALETFHAHVDFDKFHLLEQLRLLFKFEKLSLSATLL
ncbi:hypothetical protein E4U27_003897 [Claviceps purpurea]|nr:hypothetical protein E4U27_003897 [Claviceps purpurea]